MKNKIGAFLKKSNKNSATSWFDSVYKKLHVCFNELNRKTVALVHDSLVAAVTIPFSLWIRVGDDIDTYSSLYIFKHSLIFTLLAIGVFLWLQIYRGVWRYVSVKEVIAISLATFSIDILYTPLMFLLSADKPMPRSVVVISWFIMTGLLCFSRVLYRSFYDRWDKDSKADFTTIPQSRVLLLGSTSQAETFINLMQQNPQALYEVVGIIDQKKGRVGGHIHNVEIMGVLHDLPAIISQLNLEGRHPHHIVIADPEFQKQKYMQQLLEINSSFKVDLAKLPNSDELTTSGPYGIEIKPIQIEDLLNHKPIDINRSAIQNLIKGQVVMITGAGGTIGSELARQIAGFEAKNIILADHSEFPLYKINLELKKLFPAIQRTIVLMDVTDQNLVDNIMNKYKPDLVFHAAALKHALITQANVCQTILTNVIGTRNMAEACQKYNVQAMVHMSSAVAVCPSDVLGASKNVGEKLCHAVGKNSRKNSTSIIVVRFSNVLESPGSVIPLFKQQLAQGGPLTVSHPQIKRQFITAKQTIELILQATVLGLKSDKTIGQTFVIDSGDQIQVVNLAERMIQLTGLKPHEDIKISFTGLRPGEKMTIELFDNTEKLMQTSCNGLMLAVPGLEDEQKLMSQIKIIETMARMMQAEQCTIQLKQLVPSYDNSVIN